jgi:predicted ATP-grasp superfamily ATP-dependent carboligase
MNVLITDANKRVALYALRSLGKRGIDVTAAEIETIQQPIGFYSKYCRNKILTPQHKDDKYAKVLLELSRKFDVLIPISTESLIPISKHIDEFNAITKVPIPRYESLEIAVDKKKTLEFAQQNGLSIPQTFSPRDEEELRVLSKELNYPSVIKIREGSGAKGVLYANSPSDLIYKYKSLQNVDEYPLIQEYIKGSGYGVFALFNRNSKPRAVFVHRRIREYPISGGASTFCESVKDTEILNCGLKLLEKLKWYGLAMVEFKMDANDNKPKLMEINPRFWGSMPLAIASGVDFPYLLYKMAIDGDIKSSTSYKTGVRTRFLFADLLACYQYFKKRQDKGHAIWDTLQPFFDKNVNEGLLTLDDPVPGLRQLLNRFSRIRKQENGVEI